MRTKVTEMLGVEFPILAFSHCRTGVRPVGGGKRVTLRLLAAFLAVLRLSANIVLPPPRSLAARIEKPGF